MPDQEIWRGVPGCSRYLVSSLGNIRRLYQGRKRGGHPWDRRLRPYLVRSTGYLSIRMVRDDGGDWEINIQRLVLLVFTGPPLDGQQARHLNGIKADNRLCNLRWGFRAENEADKVLHGTRPFGVRVSVACLSDLKVRAGLALSAQGAPMRLVARVLGVTLVTWWKVVHGLTWKHVDRAGLVPLVRGKPLLPC